MSETKLKEGRDFTFENGLMVLSREYLLQRGYCCRSGCRNCPYGFKKETVVKVTPRVVSLVPSWTETLIAAGVNVVGRTKYCIHPKAKVIGIPEVGGTKKIDPAALDALNPDLILIDREENSLEIAEFAGERAFVSDITDIKQVGPTLGKMAQAFSAISLLEFATRWEKVCGVKNPKTNILNLPGVLEWISPPQNEIESILYLIWKKPLMAASKDTFIGSVLSWLGLAEQLENFPSRYPEITLSKYDKDKTLLLFSSEPYPFAKEKELINSLGFPAAIVDGEKYSWFGIRSLEFLESFI